MPTGNDTNPFQNLKSYHHITYTEGHSPRSQTAAQSNFLWHRWFKLQQHLLLFAFTDRMLTSSCHFIYIFTRLVFVVWDVIVQLPVPVCINQYVQRVSSWFVKIHILEPWQNMYTNNQYFNICRNSTWNLNMFCCVTIAKLFLSFTADIWPHNCSAVCRVRCISH